MNWQLINNNAPKNILDLEKILLKNRDIKTKKQIEDFFSPKLSDIVPEGVGIDKEEVKKALGRIKKAVEKKEQIVIFGDYDVDGVCGTAILWETLNSLGAKVLPYIPHRIEEGYGLSERGIKNLGLVIKNPKLIITVDNGIVANDAVSFANKEGIDVIVTDHHTLGNKKPDALAILHTTKLCGTGVAYLLAQEIFNKKKTIIFEHLSLVGLATIADLVPLVGANRTLLKFGLEELHKTRRPGLLALFAEAGIEKGNIGTYEIGHIIAPRLNAMGRLGDAMDSLRLICTHDAKRAKDLASLLGNTNRERQLLTEEKTLHASSFIKENKLNDKKLLFVVHESYEPGIIGLIAGRLTEEFYKPSIVLSKGEKYSKASARSISGFNIIEFIREASDLLVDAGGHPMAAGFTVENEKLELLQEKLEEIAEKLLKRDDFVRNLRIDAKIPSSFINYELLDLLQKFSPFGMANPQPVFVTENVAIEDIKLVGQEGRHARFRFKSQNSSPRINGIGFNMGERTKGFHIGDVAQIAYSVEDDTWNGNRRLQLKIRDIKIYEG